MKTLAQARQRVNRSYPYAVEKLKPNEIAASIDTVELFFAIPPRGLRTSIEAKFGRRVMIKPCFNRTRYQRGVRVVINRPTLAVILIIIDLLKSNRGACVHRVDLAFDLTMGTNNLAWQLAQYLDAHVLLKWRPARASKEAVESTVYWAMKSVTRNLVCYHKKLRTVRLELRFFNAGSVRRAHLHNPSDWISLDPRQLFEHHLKLVAFTNLHIERTVRRAVDKDRRSYIIKRADGRSSHHPVCDLFRSRLARRVRSRFERIDMQLFTEGQHSLSFVETLPLRDLLDIPTFLTWPQEMSS